MKVSQSDIDKLDDLLIAEKSKNNALMSKLLMFKDIIEKKEYEYLTMSDKEKLNAKIVNKGVN